MREAARTIMEAIEAAQARGMRWTPPPVEPAKWDDGFLNALLDSYLRPDND